MYQIKPTTMEHDKNIAITTEAVKAFVMENKDGTFTIFSSGKGGAIITATTEKEAKSKFEEALQLAFAIKNLITYHTVANAEIDDMPVSEAKKFTSSEPIVEYSEVC
jgi:hypothetical protein